MASVTEAEPICGYCPVRKECLSAADRIEGGLSAKLIDGIWGDETPQERVSRRAGLSSALRASLSLIGTEESSLILAVRRGDQGVEHQQELPLILLGDMADDHRTDDPGRLHPGGE
jgi:Transcription factor WhiB